MSSVVAIVKSIVGQVVAVSPEGIRRVLIEGDRLMAGEQVLTGPEGAVTLQLPDGRQLDMGRDSQWSSDTPTSTTNLAEATAQAAPSVAELQQAIAAGADPTKDLEATAAGQTTGTSADGGNAGGGHSVVMLTETADVVNPNIGFNTAGLGNNAVAGIQEDAAVPQRESTLSLSATSTLTEEGGALVYTATVTQAPLSDLTITLSNGSVITITAGQTTGSVTVQVPNGNTPYLDAHDITTTITGTTGGGGLVLTTNPAPATTTITDTVDTTTVTLTAGSATSAEGTSITYTATLTNPAQTPVTVTLSDGSTIIIRAGESTGSVVVAAPANDVYNSATTVSTSITGATGGNFESLVSNPAPAVVQITDTIDTTVASITGSTQVTEGQPATYTISLSNPAQTEVTINLTYSGTAANGTDYTQVVSVKIPAGSSSVTFDLATLNDTIPEGVENVTVSIGAITGGNFENVVVSGTNGSVTTTIIDNDALPVVDLNGAAAGTNNEATFTEGQTGVQIAANISVTDVDSPNLQGAKVTLTNAQPDDSLVVGSPNPAITVTTAVVNGQIVLTLSGSASAAAYEAVIKSITFSNSSQNPSPVDRNITVTVSDGQNDSVAATSTVHVLPVNDAPTSVGNGSISFTEGDAGTTLAGKVTLGDVDNDNLQSGKVTLVGTQTGDSLVVGAPNANITVTTAVVNGNIVLTLTGNATKAEYQAVIDSITFSNNSQNPTTGTRSITVTVNDGALDSTPSSTSVTVTPVNDAPTSVGNGSISFTEGDAGTTLAGKVTLGDVDNDNLQSGKVTLVGTQTGDSLVVGAPNANITVTTTKVDGNIVLTLTGNATKAEYQAVIDSIIFSNNSENPTTGTRSITVTVNDGALDSTPSSTSVTVTPVNDAPTSVGNGSISFTEGDAGTTLAGKVTLGDVDNDNLQSGKVTLVGTQTGDSLVVGAPNANITVTTTKVDGNIVLTLTGNATKAEYQAVIDSITFSNSSENPTTGPRSITVTVNDGALDSTPSSTSVTVTPVNDAPTSVGNGSISFTEGDAGTTLAGKVSLGDVDNDNLQSGKVTLVGTQTGDSLVVGAPNANITVTTAVVNGNIVLTLTGNATKAEYQAVIDSITFSNNSENPTTGTRSITVTVNDGALDSVASSTSVTVTPVNDAPTSVGNGGISFTEGDAGTTLAGKVTLGDVDNDNLQSGKVTLVGTQTGDSLVVGAPNANITVTTTKVDGNIVLTLTGNATKAEYQAVIDSITFSNNSENPTTGPRSITVTVNDGALDSVASSTSVTVTPVNDAPTSVGNGGISFTEGDAGTTLAGKVTLGDVDNDNLQSGKVTLVGTQTGDSLVVGAPNANITVTTTKVDGNIVLTLTGNATKAEYQAVIDSITFSNNSENPTTGPRSITVTVNDGALDSTPSSTSVTVTPVNDAPTSVGNGGISFTEGDAGTTLAGKVTLGDVDNDNLQSGKVTLVGTQTGDSLVVGAPNANITVTTTKVDGNIVLTLTGNATKAEYQAVIDSITFSNNSQNPTTGTRSITVTVNDGALDSTPSSTSVTVTPVNDAPVVDLNGKWFDGINTGTLPYFENAAPMKLMPLLTVGDVDSPNLQSATVTITNAQPGDKLVFDNSNGKITITSELVGGQLIYTLKGAATPAEYANVLKSVAFVSEGNDPVGGKRDITVTVNDGELDSAVAHAGITVIPVNDSPILDLDTGANGSGYTTAYTENGAPISIGGTVSIADPDNSTLKGAVVTLTNAKAGDVLSAADQFGIHATITNTNGKITVTLTGTASKAEYEAMIKSITYSNTSEDPDQTPRKITVTVSDGNLINGLSNTSTTTINVTAVNDKPTLSFGSSEYIENHDSVSIAPGLNIADVDNTTLSKAVITLTDLKSGDLVGSDHDLGNGNTDIGGIKYTVSGPDANGTLIITLTGTATKAQYQALIESIKFVASGDNPTGGDRGVNITVTDSGLKNGGTSLETSTAFDGKITVTPVNDAPVLHLDTGTDYSIGFTENGAPISIGSANVSIADPDNTTLKGATITLTNAQEGDVLAAADQFGIHATINDTRAVDGKITVTLTGDATLAQYQAMIQSITYQNTSDNPSVVDRTITVQVDDGSAAHNLSNVATTTIAVTAVNDAPVLDLNGPAGGSNSNTTFTEGGNPLKVMPFMTITDPDSPTFKGATVTLNNPQTDDNLYFASTNAKITVTSAIVDGKLVFTLTGEATQTEYNDLLKSLRFQNTSDNPSNVNRVIDVTINDGTDNSNTAQAIIRVVPVNDAPTVSFSGGEYTENGAAVALVKDLHIIDVDSGQLSGAKITLSGIQAEDLIVSQYYKGGTSGDTLLGIHYELSNDASGNVVITLSGNASIGNYETLINSITYANNSDNPSLAGRGVRIDVTDVDAHGSNNLPGFNTGTVTVNPVNDAPTVTFTGGQYTENAAATPLVKDLVISDVDSGQLSGAKITLSGIQAEDLITSSYYNGGTSGNTPLGIHYELSTDASGNVVITLSGNASIENYQTLISSLKYANSSENPSAAPRGVTIEVTDVDAHGSNNLSGSKTGNLTVTPVNDAPTVVAGAHGSGKEDDGQTNSGIAITLNGGDVDGRVDHFNLVDLGAHGTFYADAAHTIAIDATTNIPASGNSATIYFVPDADWNGTNNFTYKAVDNGLAGKDVLSSPVVGGSVTVAAVNDAPVLGPVGNHALGNTWVETPATGPYTPDGKGPGLIAANLTLSDIDSSVMKSAVVTITNAKDGDVLTVKIGNTVYHDGDVVTVNGTSLTLSIKDNVLTLTGDASTAVYQTVLRGVQFDNTSHNPDNAQRDITITVNDGGAENASSTIHSYINVIPSNDTPVVTGAPVVFTEGDDAKSIIGSLTLTDADNTTMSKAVVTLTGMQPGDVLSIGAAPQGVTVTEIKTNGVVTGYTLEGTATNDQYKALIDSIKFNAPGDNPTGGIRNVTVTITDSGDVDHGSRDGVKSTTYTSTIDVKPVNDAPTVVAGAHGSGNEDDGQSNPGIAIVLNGGDVDGSVDHFNLVDLGAHGTFYADAAHTIAIDATTNIPASGNSATIYFVPDADWNGTNNFTYKAVDNGLAGKDVLSSPVVGGSVTVAAVNDAPVLGPVGNHALGNTWVETPATGPYTPSGKGPGLIAANLTLSDIDSSVMKSAVVTITNAKDGDVLTVKIGNTVYHDGDVITVNGTSLNLSIKDNVLTLTGDASTAVYQTVLRGVQFDNTSHNPNNAQRDITITVNDGGAENASSTIHSYINVIPSNDTPVVTGAPVVFTEGDDAKSIIGSLTLTDADNTTMSKAVVTLTGMQPGDVLSIGAAPQGVTVTEIKTNGVVTGYTIEGTATNDQYKALIDSIKFNAPGDNPTGGIRNVTVTITDSGDVDHGSRDGVKSTTYTGTIDVKPVNDAPTVVAGAHGSGNEDDGQTNPGIAIVLNGGDVDGSVDHFNLVSLGAHGTFYADAAHTIVIDTTTNITASGNSATIYFVPDADWSGTNNFTYKAVDNGLANGQDVLSSPVVNGSVTVAPVTDTPSLTMDGGFSRGIDFQGSGTGTNIAIAQFSGGVWHTGNSNAEVEINTASTYGVNDPNQASGNHVIELERNNLDESNLYTDISAKAGETYTISVDYSPRAGALDNSIINVFWGGIQIGTLNASELGLKTYTFQVPVTADGTARLEFRAGDHNSTGGILDNISVTQNVNTGLEDQPILLSAVNAASTDRDGSESLTLTLNGLPKGSVITDGTPGHTFTAGVDKASVNLDGWNLAGLKFTAPENFSGKVPLTLIATAQDGAADPVSTKLDFSVTVIAVADAPNLAVVTATGDEDTAIHLSISPALVDKDGSETLSTVISGIPKGAVLTDGTPGHTYTAGADNGQTSVTGWDLSKLTIQTAQDYNGSFNLTVTSTATESSNGSKASSTQTLTVNVNPVNDAPVAIGGSSTGDEDTTQTLHWSNFGVTDIDSPDSALGVKITGLPANGTLLLNGVAVTQDQLISKADIDGNKLTFKPADNANGDHYATIGFQPSDGTTALGNTSSVVINVNPINDAPTAIGGSSTGDEDTTQTLHWSNFGVTDIDSPDSALGVKITGLPVNGTLLLNGVAVTQNQLISKADIDGNKLTFKPADNANGDHYATIGFQPSDGTTALGNTSSVVINVNPINDAPTAIGGSSTGDEDTTQTLHWSNFGVTDIDSPDSALGVKITGLPVNGTLLLNGVAVTQDQLISKADIDGNKLTFKPADNANGDHYATIGFQPSDGTTALGNTSSVVINVNPINDAPTAIGGSSTGDEDTTQTLHWSNFGVTDIDSPDSALGVKITGLPVNGTLLLNGVSVTQDQLISKADIDGNKLTFKPADNANGDHYATIGFQPSDGTTALGNTSSVVINVNPINDAPTAIGGSSTGDEDTTQTLHWSNFGVTDIDSPDSALGVKITGLPVNGTLLLNGVAVTQDQLISKADIDGNKLTFKPADNANGDHYATIGFQPSDGTTALGNTSSVVINVNPINDAPTAIGGSSTGDEDTTQTLHWSNFGVTDIDSPDSALGVKITGLPVNGTLLLNGVAVTQNQLISKADIDGNKLTFKPADDANGQNYATIGFQPSDGTTALGNASSVVINVNPVNDAPVANPDHYTPFTGSLQGNYYGYKEGVDGPNLGTIKQALDFIASHKADASFDAKTLSYGSPSAFGNDLGHTGNLETFLGADKGSLTYASGNTQPNTSDAIIELDGSVTMAAGTYSLKITADDGYIVLIDGKQVAAYDANQSPTDHTTQFTLTTGGVHDIQIVYWDQGGQAQLKVEVATVTGDTVGSYYVLGTNPEVPLGTAVLTTLEDTALVIKAPTLVGNDTDVEGDKLTISMVKGNDPANPSQIIDSTGKVLGTVALDAATGNVLFTPAANVNGEVTFSYSVTDGKLVSNVTTVTVNVVPVNDAPVVTDSGIQYTEGGAPVSIVSGLNISDVDSANLSKAVVTLSHLQASDVLTSTLAASGKSWSGITLVKSGSEASGTVVYTLTGTASKQAYNDLISSITYKSGTAPGTISRGVDIQVTDSGDSGHAPATSTVVHSDIAVSAITNLVLTAASNGFEGSPITYTVTLKDNAGNLVNAKSNMVVTLDNNTTITIAAGTSSKSVDIAGPKDDVYKDPTDVTHSIKSATDGGLPALVVNKSDVTTHIADTLDDTKVTLSADKSTVLEGSTVTYTATLDHVAQTKTVLTLSNSQTITIEAGSQSGSSAPYTVANDAYTSAPLVVTVTGVTSTTANGKTIVNDGNFEHLDYSNASATTTINDTGNNASVTKISISGDSTVAEGGTASYNLHLTNPSHAEVTVTLNYSGTALNGTDFQGQTKVTIPANSSDYSFTIKALTDNLVEGAENFTVTLANPAGGGFEALAVDTANASVTTTITDMTVPAANGGTATGNEGTGTTATAVIFKWADFGISNAASDAVAMSVKITNLPAAASTSGTPSGGTLQYLDNGTWKAVTLNQVISKTLIDAGGLKYVPVNNDVSGDNSYSGTGVGNMQHDYAQLSFAPVVGTLTGTTSVVKIDITPVADQPTVTLGTSQVHSTGLVKDVWVGTLTGLGNGGNGADAATILKGFNTTTAPTTHGTATGAQETDVTAGTGTKLSGLIYLEEGHTYNFSGTADDSLLITIGGTTAATALWGSNSGAINSTAYQVTKSGYYTLDIYHYNQAGPGNYNINLVDTTNATATTVATSKTVALNSANVSLYTSVDDLKSSGLNGVELHQTTGAAAGEGYYTAYTLNHGTENNVIKLQSITAAYTDNDGSETHVTKLSFSNVTGGTAALIGSVISDGNGHSVTLTSNNMTPDVSTWDLTSLTIKTPQYYNGTFTMTVTATATETSLIGVAGATPSASATANLVVTVDAATYASNIGQPGTDTSLLGTSGNDVIVGDIKGTVIVPGKNYNIAILLDSSGSMSNTAIDNAKSQLTTLFADLKNSLGSSSGVVNIMLADFDNTVHKSVSVNLSDKDALTKLQAVIDSVSQGGGTNYEDALNTATNWFNSTTATSNTSAQNLTFFITDGAPTYHLVTGTVNGVNLTYGENNRGNTRSVSLSSAISEYESHVGVAVTKTAGGVTRTVISENGEVYNWTHNSNGTWTVSTVGVLHNVDSSGHFIYEVIAGTGNSTDSATGSESAAAYAALAKVSTVEAIAVNNTITTSLIAYDSDSTPHTSIDASDLAAKIEATTTGQAPGNDTITGGDGNDILFGDMFTYGGKEGVAALKAFAEATDSTLKAATMTDKDLHHFLTSHIDAVATQANVSNNTGLADGKDTLLGGNGDDILFGQGGNDTLIGGRGDDILFGGTGSNTFVWKQGDTGSDVIKDWNKGSGNTLDLSDLLQGENGNDDANIAKFLQINKVGSDTYLEVSTTGKFDAQTTPTNAAQTADVHIKLEGVSWDNSMLKSLIVDAHTIKVDQH